MVSLCAAHYLRKFLHSPTEEGGGSYHRKWSVRRKILVFGVWFLFFKIKTFIELRHTLKAGKWLAPFLFVCLFCHCCSFMVLVFVTVAQIVWVSSANWSTSLLLQKKANKQPGHHLGFSAETDVGMLWFFSFAILYIFLHVCGPPPAFIAANVP